MKITCHGKSNLLLTAKLDTETYNKLCALPGFKKWSGRNLIVRPTPANVMHIIRNWPDANWDSDSIQFKNSTLVETANAERAREAKNSEVPILCTDFQFKRKPMAHQERDFMLHRDKENFAFFWEPGLGKSQVTIDTASWLYLNKKIDAMLVVAWPNGVHRIWTGEELYACLHPDIHCRSYGWRSGKSVDKANRLKILFGFDGFKVLSFNAEAFASDYAVEVIQEFLSKFRCLFVIDQSACIKNTMAKRTKLMLKLGHKAPYKRILEGSPNTEGPEELFSQFKFLDYKIIGHDTFTGFKNEFCKIGYFKNITGYKNLDELQRRIDPFVSRAYERDCLDLPERIYRRFSFDLSVPEQTYYNEFLRKGLVEFKEEGIELKEQLAMIKHIRLQQISCGIAPSKERTERIKGGNSRLLALESLLSSIKGKAIIFTTFKMSAKMVEELLGAQAVSYHGDIGSEEREEAKRRFQTDDTCRYFVGQIKTASIGHTLTAAEHVIFFTNDGSLRFRQEAEKRAHRKGQEKRVTVWDIVANKTMDRKILSILQQKDTLARAVMNDPDNFFLVEDDAETD